VKAVVCTASFLRALGIDPARGRLFTDEEERRRERVLVLGDGRIQQERRNPVRRPARELTW
jgi:hypothetical protein